MRNNAQQRLGARKALQNWHREVKPSLPKCGAKRRTDGLPCEHVAMTNGRCYRHGGLTPSGENWHKPRWPNGDAPNAEDKLNRKLRDLERAAKKRAARLAGMTAEERERYDQWHLARRPGSKAARARAKEERSQRQAFAALASADTARPADDQASHLSREIARLEALREQLSSEPSGGPSIFD